MKNKKIKFSNFSKITLLIVSTVEFEIDFCAECWQFIDVMFMNVLNSDSLMMKRNFKNEIDEILKTKFHK